MPQIALVRRPSPRIADGLVTHIDRTPVDAALAAEQHAGYVAALTGAGWAIVEVPPAEDMPDSAFIEDTMVVCDGLAVMSRPGAEERRAEVPGAEEVVRGLGLEVARIEAPGTLDGGDVLQVDRTVYVGQSGRTDAEGMLRLHLRSRDEGPGHGPRLENAVPPPIPSRAKSSRPPEASGGLSSCEGSASAAQIRIGRDGNAGRPIRRRPHAPERDRLRQIALGEGERLALELEPVVLPLAADGEPEAVTLHPPADGLRPPAGTAVLANHDKAGGVLPLGQLGRGIHAPGADDRRSWRLRRGGTGEDREAESPQ